MRTTSSSQHTAKLRSAERSSDLQLQIKKVPCREGQRKAANADDAGDPVQPPASQDRNASLRRPRPLVMHTGGNDEWAYCSVGKL